MAMVEFIDISKRYGNTDALSSIDLCIERGEFLTLLGPSGSGKTTLLNLIAGLIKPSGGRLLIDGKDTASLSPGERSLGMVFQNYALMPHMTVFENIAFPLRVRRMAEAEIRRKVQEVLELVRLPNVAARKPKELSGGQQQRVSLARCIVYSPALILMDEPLGALDKKLREQMQFEIKQLHAELGITMLNVTHDQEEALTLSDRIVLMNNGAIEQIGAPSELYFSPRSVFAADFIGQGNFFEAQVARVQGSVVDVQAEGLTWSLHTGKPGCQQGKPTMVLVRPENIRLDAPDSAAGADGEIRLDGVVIDHLILGGIVKHRVRLASGKEVTVQQANHPGTRLFGKREAARVSFLARSAVLLPR
ncbi:ABC transporter ATP-binding protein [Bordetella ansorpii]|uniref:ABC transporter ATP-binding protein n=1 Tax=Bordetella ansorpii TaxID=288768 RepID=A0A157Q7F6_9BORD|nr:ABC transporter ATP-binding protein [Bordetella ansorpii]SAI41661.1 ABC transporter ATP-binding protein [Bordetella ansorpii]